MVAVMAKLYIQHAFGLIPVQPKDWHLLGYKCGGQYYFNVVLPFGSISPLTYSVSYQRQSGGSLHTRQTNNQIFWFYCDDFLIVAPPHFSFCAKTLKSCPKSASSRASPELTTRRGIRSTTLTFLDIQLDSVSQTLALPPSKLELITNLLSCASANLPNQTILSRYPIFLLGRIRLRLKFRRPRLTTTEVVVA